MGRAESRGSNDRGGGVGSLAGEGRAGPGMHGGEGEREVQARKGYLASHGGPPGMKSGSARGARAGARCEDGQRAKGRRGRRGARAGGVRGGGRGRGAGGTGWRGQEWGHGGQRFRTPSASALPSPPTFSRPAPAPTRAAGEGRSGEGGPGAEKAASRRARGKDKEGVAGVASWDGRTLAAHLSPGSASSAARRTKEPVVSLQEGGPARVSTIPPRAPHLAIVAPQPPPLRSRLVNAARRAAQRGQRACAVARSRGSPAGCATWEPQVPPRGPAPVRPPLSKRGPAPQACAPPPARSERPGSRSSSRADWDFESSVRPIGLPLPTSRENGTFASIKSASVLEVLGCGCEEGERLGNGTQRRVRRGNAGTWAVFLTASFVLLSSSPPACGPGWRARSPRWSLCAAGREGTAAVGDSVAAFKGGGAGVRVAMVTARLLMPKRAGGQSEYTS